MKTYLTALLLLAFIGAACTPQAQETVTAALTEEPEAMMEEDAMMEGHKGMVLSGSTTPYLEFTQADYEKALSEGKTVYLEFYASWCPSCKNDAPNIESYFAAQSDPNVIGFRVNYKDSDTDSDETALAKEYGITYQHTRVIIKNGEVVYRDLGSFNAAQVTAAAGA